MSVKYSMVRINPAGHILDVSIFGGAECDFAQYVADLARKIYPQHTITVEIAFDHSWDHVKKDFEGVKK